MWIIDRSTGVETLVGSLRFPSAPITPPLLAHVLRSISEVVETKRGRGRSFGNRLSRLLREAMELRQAYHRGEAADFAAEAERLRREATYHLRDRPMSDADNWRLQNELGWHDDRGNLLRFLDDPSIETTNNRHDIGTRYPHRVCK